MQVLDPFFTDSILKTAFREREDYPFLVKKKLYFIWPF